MNVIQRILIAAIDVYTMIIFIRAIVSWFRPDPYNELYLWLIRLTEPVLAPIRKILPMSGIDFSPLIVLLALHFIKSIIVGM
ncbi:MAG: YggT family protein [Candidatus Cloacimonadales bacterium]